MEPTLIINAALTFEFEDKVAKLNRRADKLGMPHVQFDYGQSFERGADRGIGGARHRQVGGQPQADRHADFLADAQVDHAQQTDRATAVARQIPHTPLLHGFGSETGVTPNVRRGMRIHL